MNKESIVRKLESHKIGLERGTLNFLEHKKEWVSIAKWLCEMIMIETEDKAEAIGSTVISGLMSKPILDILLLYKEDTLSSKKISKLEGLGFTYKGDIIASLYNQEIDKSRHFFAYYDDFKKFDYAHIHALHKNSKEANEKIAFRNTLLEDSKSVQKYNHFKKNYLEKKVSREEYRISKEDIIRKILMKK